MLLEIILLSSDMIYVQCYDFFVWWCINFVVQFCAFVVWCNYFLFVVIIVLFGVMQVLFGFMFGVMLLLFGYTICCLVF